jgi:hypothetical protein
MPLLVLVMFVAFLGCLVVVHLGVAATARARARTAADAAALAGAAAGRSAAEQAAAANGAVLVSFVADGSVVAVQVEVGLPPSSPLGGRQVGARATAEQVGGAVAGERSLLDPALRAALGRAEDLLGRPVNVLRTEGSGQVVLADADAAELGPLARLTGLCTLVGTVNPVHFAVCPPPTSSD